jgi:hypothetical protein
VGEFFTAIEQQHFFHRKTSAQPSRLKQELEWRQINHRSRAETATSTQNTFDQNARIDRQLLP